MVGVVDGEHAISGSFTVEIPLYVLVHEAYLSSLRSSRVAAGGEVRRGRNDYKLYPYLRCQHINSVVLVEASP